MIAKKLIWSIPIFVLTDYILVVGPVFTAPKSLFPEVHPYASCRELWLLH